MPYGKEVTPSAELNIDEDTFHILSYPCMADFVVMLFVSENKVLALFFVSFAFVRDGIKILSGL